MDWGIPLQQRKPTDTAIVVIHATIIATTIATTIITVAITGQIPREADSETALSMKGIYSGVFLVSTPVGGW